MARYLVTGGCGFIGSHLADALIEAGHEVRILDDLSTGKRENAPAAADLVVGDVADGATVRRAADGVDGCFHLAAVASVVRSNEDWAGTHRVNQTGTVNVLDAARTARRGGAAPVVYASSAAAYGDNADVPLGEDAAMRPLTAYGADKLGSELHARVAFAVHGVPTTGLRFFNVYGPRQDPGSPYSGVISIFADRLLRGEGLEIHGDGRQVRDFVYVADCIAHVLAAMARMTAEPRVFNVCTGRPTSVLDLAAALGAAVGTAPDISHAPARAGDVRTSLGDPRRARRALGVSAAIAIDDGLRRLVDALRAG